MIVHVVGGLIVLVGLGLFVLDQRAPAAHEDAASLKAWKIELGGPASLVLIVVGLAVFLFPYSPWYPTSPPTTTTSTTTTTTTLPEVSIIEPEIIEVVDIPGTPEGWYWEDWNVDCQDAAVHWIAADDYTEFWYIPVSALDPDGIIVNDFFLESDVPYLCRWEWEWGGMTTYWFWPRGINWLGEGDWFWFEVVLNELGYE